MLFKKEKIFGICKYVLYNKITIPNIKYKYIKYINILAKKLLCIKAIAILFVPGHTVASVSV